MEKTTKDLKTFEVGMWWYELHGGKVTVEAETAEEAERIVQENFEQFKNSLKKKQDTYSDLGDSGVDEAFETVKKDSSNKNVYREKFNTDVYVQGTTGSFSSGNILELGKVVYSDYLLNTGYYKFTRPRTFREERNYYNLGDCSIRERNKVLFETGDFRKLFINNLEKEKYKYNFANSIEEVLTGEKYVLVLQMHTPGDTGKPRRIQIRAIKAESYSYKTPYRLHIMDNNYLSFCSNEELMYTIVMNKRIDYMNGEKFFIFLNTPEHLNLLERLIEELIIDTLI